MPVITRPDASEHHPYYLRYFELVPDGDLTPWMVNQGQAVDAELATLSEAQWSSRYAPGKWTAKQLVLHIIDTERIMTTRALAYARGESARYPSFDEDAFAAASGAEERSGKDLRSEWRAVRESTLALMRGLPRASLDQRATTGDKELTVRSLFWLVAGHATHHTNVLRERYLAIP